MNKRIKNDCKLSYGKLYRNLINKNPPNTERSKLLEEFRLKALDDLKKDSEKF